jgi:hypothetical protein
MANRHTQPLRFIIIPAVLLFGLLSGVFSLRSALTSSSASYSSLDQELAGQFPAVKQHLAARAEFAASIRQVNEQTIAGLEMRSSDNDAQAAVEAATPVALKPEEKLALQSLAARDSRGLKVSVDPNLPEIEPESVASRHVP